ncbi:hypothetical protein BX281_0537 [Streptomyces sp. Ag82_O1-15]|nr:hypothetical protein BX281_0537 [Streptomyces sp. Ag82_O1-15]
MSGTTGPEGFDAAGADGIPKQEQENLNDRVKPPA